MPVDLTVTYADGSSEEIYIPLQMMRWEKPVESDTRVADDWAWAYPTYSVSLQKPKGQITSIEIDNSQMMADINRENNVWQQQ